jgi:TonB family protein
MSLSHSQCHRADRASLVRWVAGCTFIAALSGGAYAETAAPATPAPTPSGDMSPAERAQREADRVFQWIRIHSDKPRKPTSTRDDKAPASSAAVKGPGRPSPKPADGASADAATARREVARDKTEPAQPSALSSSAGTTPAPGATMNGASPDSSAAGGLVAAVAPNPVAVPEPDAPLVPVIRTEPAFPSSLMRTLRKGMVQVSFTVEPDGSVSQPQAVTSTNSRLNSAAIGTVTQWRFQPLRHAQQAVVDLGFNLD